uniref:MBD domain-containing protein n=1 Tax=Solanum lycopersicum TaxID=4081 RepID=A0A3Q7IVH4_SOLLC
MVNDSPDTLKTSARLATNPTVEFNKSNGSYDESNVLNGPSSPKTPSGFKRELYLRKDYSKMDAYYFTPSWMKLQSFSVVGTFLQQNPEFSELNYQFSSSLAP